MRPGTSPMFSISLRMSQAYVIQEPIFLSQAFAKAGWNKFLREGFLSLRGTSRCCGANVLWSFAGFFSKPPFVWTCAICRLLVAAVVHVATPLFGQGEVKSRLCFCSCHLCQANSVWSKSTAYSEKIQYRRPQYTIIHMQYSNGMQLLTDRWYPTFWFTFTSCQLGCITRLWKMIFLYILIFGCCLMFGFVWRHRIYECIWLGKPWQTPERDLLIHVARFCLERWHGMITLRLCTESVCVFLLACFLHAALKAELIRPKAITAVKPRPSRLFSKKFPREAAWEPGAQNAQDGKTVWHVLCAMLFGIF